MKRIYLDQNIIGFLQDGKINISSGVVGSWHPTGQRDEEPNQLYLTQDIVAFLYDGIIDLASIESVEWIYSNEHFIEMERSQDFRFLESLERIKAKHIELELDENFQLTGYARINPYENPSKVHQKYKNSTEEVSIIECEIFFSSLQARLLGADNFEELVESLHNCQYEVIRLLEETGLENDYIYSIKEEAKHSYD